MRTGISIALVGVLFSAQGIQAAEEDAQARSWAATCTGCHGTNGRSEGGIPGIAGLDKTYIVTVMQEFKADKRAATVMHRHAKGYSDAQIDRIAAFFATQKR
jgi:cytochrome c553